jgi:hypothetical protein
MHADRSFESSVLVSLRALGRSHLEKGRDKYLEPTPSPPFTRADGEAVNLQRQRLRNRLKTRLKVLLKARLKARLKAWLKARLRALLKARLKV